MPEPSLHRRRHTELFKKSIFGEDMNKSLGFTFLPTRYISLTAPLSLHRRAAVRLTALVNGENQPAALVDQRW